jgi:hypothetical protein
VPCPRPLREETTMRAGDETFEAAARARVGGLIGDEEFLRRTARTWEVVAARLWRRWRRKLPGDVGPDDLLQEVRLLALEFVAKCDPKRGKSMGGYIVWCVIRRGQRQIHRWRNAELSGNEGRNPGRFERNFSGLRRRDDEVREDYVARVPGESVDPVAHLDTEAAFRDQLARVTRVRDALVLAALRESGGCVEGAASVIVGAPAACRELGVDDLPAARRLVRRCVEALVGEVGRLEVAVDDVRPDDDLFELPPAPAPLWQRALDRRKAEVGRRPGRELAA